MWKRSFGARHPSNSASSKCENEAWTRGSNAGPIRPWSEHSRDRLATVRRTSFPILLPGHVFSCKTQLFVHPLSVKNTFWASLPSKSESWRYENEALVHFPQKLKVEHAKMKLSCETSLKKCELKMWNEAFARDFPQNESGRYESVWKRPSNSESSKCENEAWTRSSNAGPIRPWSEHSRDRLATVRRTSFPILLPGHVLSLQNTAFRASAISQKRISCKTSLQKWQLKIWKRSFGARLPSKKWKWKMRKCSFRPRRPSKSKSWRC